MVKKCLLILLVLLCMSACTSKEEKQELDRENFNTSSTKISEYRDEEGRYYKKIVPAETSITLCYAEVSTRKTE